MTEQKIDKRVARTKTRLKEGLADLMTRKSIQEITVKELVEYVHINRSTFYLHYSDISNMLENVKRELIEEIAEVMESYPPEPFSEESVVFMKDVFFSLGSNRKLLYFHGSRLWQESGQIHRSYSQNLHSRGML